MTISVLLSLYKAEKAKNFDRAMKSIWDWQSLKPNQIVLIEDGPLTDELYSTVKEWKEKLGDILTICKNDTNLGLTKSLNKGIKHVTGDLIARMDSDDMSDPLRFERQRNFLIEHTDIDIVGGALYEFVGDVICHDDKYEITPSKEGIRRYPVDENTIHKHICKASPLCHGSVMMRANIFKEKGLKYDERYRISQDIALWFDALCAGCKISNINEVVYCMEVEDFISRRSRKKAYNEFKIYMNGIKRLHGFSFRYIYPIARLIFRLLPERLIKIIYTSSIRTKFLQKK